MLDSPSSQLTGVVHTSEITCPHCGHRRTAPMPETACVIFYECSGCGMMLQPLAGDCCVYCSYGSVPCPVIERQRRAAQLH